MEESFEPKTIGALIHDAMRAKNLSLEKLGQQTGISERFLSSLTEDDMRQMPSAPYVRGYLLRIGEVLAIDGESLWKEYTRQYGALPRSGKHDAPPSNRFLIKQLNAKTVGIAAVILVIAAVAFFRSSAFIGKPTLALESFDDSLTVATSTYTIRGTIDPENQLTVNDEAVYPGEDGIFEKQVPLSPGFNTFRFSVKGLLGKELQIVKQIYYTTSTVPSDGTNESIE
jgi:hypothetical protein